MKKLLLLCLFLIAGSLSAQVISEQQTVIQEFKENVGGGAPLSHGTELLDEQGTVFNALKFSYYDRLGDKVAVTKFKKVCPFGIIKLIVGSIDSDREFTYYESKDMASVSILGCDTVQDFNDRLDDGIYTPAFLIKK